MLKQWWHLFLTKTNGSSQKGHLFQVGVFPFLSNRLSNVFTNVV